MEMGVLQVVKLKLAFHVQVEAPLLPPLAYIQEIKSPCS